MILDTVTIRSHKQVAEATYQLVLASKIGHYATPGQFVNVQVEGFYLRRPLSIADFDEESITLIYKVVGKGTQHLATLSVGEKLSVLGPLGHGFPIHDAQEVLLVGGGLGLAPLYPLAKAYRSKGVDVNVVYGFLNEQQVYYDEAFKALGCKVHQVLQARDQLNVLEYCTLHQLRGEYVYGCGPKMMLATLQTMYNQGYISFESRMACAIGVCNGCVCKANQDNTTYKICKEGPVFAFGEVNVCD